MTKGYYTLLNDRAAVTVAGPDARAFLQGLVTQDVPALDHTPLLYSAMLTPQGKMDFDFFMSEQDGAVVLECEKNRAEALCERLKTFKLRKNLDIKSEEKQVIAAWGPDTGLKAFPYPRDPRHPRLGYRRIIEQDTVLKELNDFEKADPALYHRLCLDLTVPSHGRDIAWGEDTVADLGLERLNGVSFAKGCYMGQELTSRMHHRGLAKKGLYTITLAGEVPAPFTDIVVDGNLVGEMRSSQGGKGLAMLRHDALNLAARAGFLTEAA